MLMRPLRSRRLTLLAAGTLLASPLLAGCGFNYQTDRINTISAGVNDRTGEINVLSGVVIAGEDDLGLFVGNLVNTSTEDATFEGLEPGEELEPIEDTTSIDVPAGGQANLFDEGGIPVSGDFAAGDFVSVTLTFDTGQVTTLEVNVVTPCRQYSLDKLTELTLPTSADGSTSEALPESEATEEAGSEAEGEPGPYSCEPATPVEHGGGEEEGGPGEVAPSPEGETEE